MWEEYDGKGQVQSYGSTGSWEKVNKREDLNLMKFKIPL